MSVSGMVSGRRELECQPFIRACRMCLDVFVSATCCVCVASGSRKLAYQPFIEALVANSRVVVVATPCSGLSGMDHYKVCWGPACLMVGCLMMCCLMLGA